MRYNGNGAFTAAAGKEVTYFVNGHPADKVELQSMNMQDVRKVEYLDYPSGSNFLGAEHVVNFILHEYEYGGYTRLGLTQRYITENYSYENVFSRWAYKRMTFDIFTGANHGIIDRNDAHREHEYRFKSGTVSRIENPRATAAIRARYIR